MACVPKKIAKNTKPLQKVYFPKIARREESTWSTVGWYHTRKCHSMKLAEWWWTEMMALKRERERAERDQCLAPHKNLLGNFWWTLLHAKAVRVAWWWFWWFCFLIPSLGKLKTYDNDLESKVSWYPTPRPPSFSLLQGLSEVPYRLALTGSPIEMLGRTSWIIIW